VLVPLAILKVLSVVVTFLYPFIKVKLWEGRFKRRFKTSIFRTDLIASLF